MQAMFSDKFCFLLSTLTPALGAERGGKFRFIVSHMYFMAILTELQPKVHIICKASFNISPSLLETHVYLVVVFWVFFFLILIRDKFNISFLVL